MSILHNSKRTPRYQHTNIGPPFFGRRIEPKCSATPCLGPLVNDIFPEGPESQIKDFRSVQQKKLRTCSCRTHGLARKALIVILSTSQSAPLGSFCPFGRAATRVTAIRFVPVCSITSKTKALGGSGSSGAGVGVPLLAKFPFMVTKSRCGRCWWSKGANVGTI